MKIRVQYTAELIVDAEEWDNQYENHDHVYRGDLWDHLGDIATDAAGCFLSKDYVPRWARDAITVTHERTEVVDYGI